jgi:hypothetical protein
LKDSVPSDCNQKATVAPFLKIMDIQKGNSSIATTADKANITDCGGVHTGSSCTKLNYNIKQTGAIQHKAVLYMTLLAIQFGIQPIITRRYTSSMINKSTVLFVQEIIKFIMAYGMLLLSGDTSKAIQGTKYTRKIFLISYL